MDRKTTPEIWALRLARTLRIPDIRAAAADCAPLIERQIAASGLLPDGPWLFISRDLPKDGRTAFDWSICRPVRRPAQYDGSIELIHLPPIPVAGRLYHGPLRSLFTGGYAPLLAELAGGADRLSGESREIYHDWPGEGEPRIEIQFGLVP